MYELKGVGLDGKEKLFQKPWAMTTTMFVGETQLLPVTHPGLTLCIRCEGQPAYMCQ